MMGELLQLPPVQVARTLWPGDTLKNPQTCAALDN
jgi:hypothetical protein